MDRQIELDENVAGKERRPDVGELASVPNGFQPLRLTAYQRMLAHPPATASARSLMPADIVLTPRMQRERVDLS